MADQERQPSRVSSRRAAISPSSQAASGGSPVRPSQREADRLPGLDVQRRGNGSPIDPEAARSGQQQPVGSAPGGQAAGDRFENRLDQAVFGPGSVADLDFQLPVGAGQAAHQYPRRPGTQVVAAVVTANRHGVGQHCGAGRRPERGFQHHRLVHVGAAGLEVAGRRIAKCPPAASRMWRCMRAEIRHMRASGRAPLSIRPPCLVPPRCPTMARTLPPSMPGGPARTGAAP